jgi:hypothetical protein
VTIEPPEDFSFSSNYEAVVTYLDQIRKEIGQKGPIKTVVADLKTIKTLCPSAAICLVAELERWQKISRKRLYPKTVASWDSQVRSNLYAMGFFQLLGTRLPNELRRQRSENLPIWLPFSSAVLVDGGIPKQLRRRIERALGSLGGLRMALYTPLIEAIKNAVEHAYAGDEVPDEVKQRVGHRWWLLGVADPAARKITIVLYDQGITIPASLPRSFVWDRILPILKAKGGSDNAQIEAAIEYGRSRTQQTERGKGLSDIVALAAQHRDNHVEIYSRLGRYHAIGSKQQDVDPSPVPLNGTLIRWDINILDIEGQVL